MCLVGGWMQVFQSAYITCHTGLSLTLYRSHLADDAAKSHAGHRFRWKLTTPKPHREVGGNGSSAERERERERWTGAKSSVWSLDTVMAPSRKATTVIRWGSEQQRQQPQPKKTVGVPRRRRIDVVIIASCWNAPQYVNYIGPIDWSHFSALESSSRSHYVNVNQYHLQRSLILGAQGHLTYIDTGK